MAIGAGNCYGCSLDPKLLMESQMATDDYCVYILTCTVTGFKYVGKTDDLDRRLAEHVYEAKNGGTADLHKAIREYGWDSFTPSIHKENLSHSHAKHSEAYMIATLNTCNGPGYNMTTGGDNDG